MTEKGVKEERGALIAWARALLDMEQAVVLQMHPAGPRQTPATKLRVLASVAAVARARTSLNRLDGSSPKLNAEVRLLYVERCKQQEQLLRLLRRLRRQVLYIHGEKSQ